MSAWTELGSLVLSCQLIPSWLLSGLRIGLPRIDLPYFYQRRIVKTWRRPEEWIKERMHNDAQSFSLSQADSNVAIAQLHTNMLYVYQRKSDQ